ncbi:unnamed protein product [Protopolystoma xenopodis]|uniref:Uncharacterized protein n=1 Tax=Protopolystoma xenopodis TaxID=117903 RepID=A0A448XIZ1_9PLAT|nr:unnamed protein product [Protopolystoma xenopodis]
MRCLWLSWCLLTWLAAMLCTAGCLLPYWLKGTVFLPGPLGLDDPSSDGERRPEAEADASSPTVADGNVSGQKRGVALHIVSQNPADLGLFRRCGYPAYANSSSARVEPTRLGTVDTPVALVAWQPGCGHYVNLGGIPHLAWRISLFCLASACTLLFFVTFFLFFAGFAVYLLYFPVVYLSCQALQFVSGESPPLF